MKYAVIKTGGKQYRVTEGAVLEVERLSPSDKAFTFDQVLLYSADGNIQVGQPLVSGVTVSATLLEDVKGDKIRVSQFKAKARHRRVHGHRQALSRVKIETIGTAEKKAKAAKEEKPTVEVKSEEK